MGEEADSPGESIDALIAQNIVEYSAWADRRCDSVPSRKEALPIG